MRLRDETAAVHREAERSGYIADLIRGRATREGYRFFLRNLAPVYAALESALEAAPVGDAALTVFRHPSLRRLPSLLRDIDVIGRPAEDMLPVAETGAYVAAIERSAQGAATRLVAHAYARYLGDLSGGQIIKPILARSLGLSPTALQFYTFEDVEDTQAAKDSMRRALDEIASTSATADAIVEEAIVAFRHNIALSVAVACCLEASAQKL